MAEIMSKSTHWFLEQWVIWVCKGGGAPSDLGVSIIPDPDITDEQAMQVDRAIAQLKLRHPRLATAVKIYFFNEENISEVSRKMKINRKNADVLVQSGISWIDAYLGDLMAA